MTTSRLSLLRKELQRASSPLSYYIIPSEDCHSSEYTAACDERRAYISNFDGSAGLAIVGTQQNDAKAAWLFTDGRYFNQATKQLDDNWVLMKQGMPDVPTWQDFLISNVKQGQNVGIDASLIPFNEATKLQTALQQKGASLIGGEINYIDKIWEDRPAAPSNKVVSHAVKYAGLTASEKIQDLRKWLEKKEVYGFVVSSIDEVAWLFNLRGSDVPFNPVFFSYAIVTLDCSYLFIDESKMSADVRATIPKETQMKAYTDIFKCSRELGDIASKQINGNDKMLVGNRGSWALALALGKKVEAIRSPIGDVKSIKNATELEGMRECHIRDGAALVTYLAHLEELAANDTKIDEVDAATYLEQRRMEKEHFVGLSFPTISSTGPNGAIIHYKPEKRTCATIDWNAIYLCDSGAQYKDGTTDITRTWHYRTPTEFERRAFTLVLKGHIAIARAVFPRGTTGYTIDTLARQFLWKDGLDYFHGTSHGVGSYLNVHEPPIGIGQRIIFVMNHYL